MKNISIVLAPDKFKGTLSSSQAAQAMYQGLTEHLSGERIRVMPLADGGEGTLALLAEYGICQLRDETVTGPFGERITAQWGLSLDGSTAWLELSRAAGPSAAPNQRDPMTATTRGLGELMAKAIEAGVSELVIFTGGSITCDGGTGAMTALGFRFLDPQGCDLPQGGGFLNMLDRIDSTGANPALARTKVTLAADVFCPMHGPEGAALVFAPQKGASPAQLPVLDSGLARLCSRIKISSSAADYPLISELVKQGGAAGAAAGGIAALCRGTLVSGGHFMAETIGLPQALEKCNLLITGEGRTDGQTILGKGPWIAASLAIKAGVPALILSGSLGPGWEECLRRGAAVISSQDSSSNQAAGANNVSPPLLNPQCAFESLRSRAEELGKALSAALGSND